jgi:hypothetical protein
MKMYGSLFVSFFLLFISTQVTGQGYGGRSMDPNQLAERQTADMVDSLALSEAQASKVAEVNLKYAKKMQEMRSSMEGDWSQMREVMMKVRTDRLEEMKTYLTTDQHAKWLKIEEERRANRGQGNRPDRNKDGKKKKKPNSKG